MRNFAALILLIATACSQATTAQPQPRYTSAVYLPQGPERAALTANCQICHGGDMYETQRLSRATWEAEVTKMVGFGSPLPNSAKEAVVNYLAEYLGTTVPRVSAVPVVTAPPISYTGPPTPSPRTPSQ
jgi:hypothetical protein